MLIIRLAVWMAQKSCDHPALLPVLYKLSTPSTVKEKRERKGRKQKLKINVKK